MNVTLTADDGRTYDITEHFQVLYDCVTGGMDWGSGFLDGNDALIVMQAGAAAGFEITLDGSAVNMISESNAVLKAFPDHPTAGPTSMGSGYYALKRKREEWVKETFGDPVTWDSIAAYRERLAEMENAE